LVDVAFHSPRNCELVKFRSLASRFHLHSLPGCFPKSTVLQLHLQIVLLFGVPTAP
jgi:hypothetical protein